MKCIVKNKHRYLCYLQGKQCWCGRGVVNGIKPNTFNNHQHTHKGHVFHQWNSGKILARLSRHSNNVLRLKGWKVGDSELWWLNARWLPGITEAFEPHHITNPLSSLILWIHHLLSVQATWKHIFRLTVNGMNLDNNSRKRTTANSSHRVNNTYNE